MNHTINTLKLGISLLLLSMACAKEQTSINTPTSDADILYNVVLATSTEGNTETYVQALEDLSEGEISFINYGFEVPSTRTVVSLPRVMARCSTTSTTAVARL